MSVRRQSISDSISEFRRFGLHGSVGEPLKSFVLGWLEANPDAGGLRTPSVRERILRDFAAR